jgi:hypothetical protein
MTDQSTTFDDRIAVVLQPDTASTSANLAALIEEVESVIAKAEKDWIDQTPSLDKGAARQALMANLVANRLRMLALPRTSVLLYGDGVPVTIPRAERYAVHKLMVAVERQDQVKSGKHLHQAETLIEVLTAKRPIELASAWQIAWDTGPRWRAKLEAATERLSERAQKNLDFVLARAKTSRRRRARPKNPSQQGSML